MRINQQVLVSGADYFNNSASINPYMNSSISINQTKAAQEHNLIRQTFQDAGIKITKVKPPKNCQDGVYTANWALVRGEKAVMSRLPNVRKDEEAYAEGVLRNLDKQIIHIPDNLSFSGQGDALPVGNFLLAGSGYRTDKKVHQFLAEALGYEVISLKTIPKLDQNAQPVVNQASGWADSDFYDIDLAISVLKDDLIAYCPEAFTLDSQAKIANLPITKIEVSLDEAKNGFACNLISTGKTVIMSNQAPSLQTAIEEKGLQTIPISAPELQKGGGFIRCVSLTLNN